MFSQPIDAKNTQGQDLEASLSGGVKNASARDTSQQKKSPFRINPKLRTP